MKEVVRYAEGGSLQQRAAVAAAKDIGFGRFADAAARHLALRGPQAKDFSQALWKLMEGARAATSRATAPATASR